MVQNKPKDDEFFNCGEEHENRYVSKLYGSNSEKVVLSTYDRQLL